MGGLTTGLILKKHKIEPIIFEKQSHIGGSFHSYNVGKYQVDTGLHMLTRGTTGELPMLMKKYIDPEIFKKKFVEQKTYEVCLRNKHDYMPTNLSKIMKFKVISPKDRLSFTRMMIKFLRITREGTDFDGSSYDYVKKYITSNDMLYFLNSLSWMCNGCSIKDGSLSRFLDTFIRQKKLSPSFVLKNLAKSKGAEEDWYPICGLKEIPKMFVDEGLDVRTQHEVDEILIKDNTVVGVRVGNKTYETNMVIYGGLVRDLKRLTKNKLNIPIPKEEEYKAITIWIGLNKKVYDWKGISKIKVMQSMDAPHWGLFITDFDSSVAPEGHQLFGMSTILHKDTETMVKEMKRTIEEFLPDYKNYLDMEHVQVIRAEKTLQKHGNDMFKLPDQKTNIKGLYVVGTDTQGWGSGGTLCADSANRCWKHIQNDYKF